MAIDAPYTNGAVLANGGSLKVTDANRVENLNSSLLQGRDPSDFLQIGSDFVNSGITQNGANITANSVNVSNTGVTYIFDTGSTIKIGNVIIKSSDSGNGILVGLE